MKLQITTSKSSAAIRLAGALDIYAVESARDALLQHVAAKSAVELDLGGIEACDAAGLQLLCAAHNSAVAAGKTFQIRVSAPSVVECGDRLGFPPEAFRPSNAGIP
jgi:anti-anti-sigma factor